MFTCCHHVTLNVDLDLSNVNVTFGTDTEHLCQISWKSDLYFLRNHNKNERTNQPTTNNQRSWSQYLLAVVIIIIIIIIIIMTSTATRSCWDPGTAAIYFWLPGCVRRRLQLVTLRPPAAAANATRYGRRHCYYGRATPLLRRCCCCIANLVIES